jgi:haloacetate dehalogenase
MFEGFIDELVDLGDVRLRVRFGGDGPRLLLIHGHSRTSATWHRVAPELITAGFTVVCPVVLQCSARYAGTGDLR